MASVATQTRKIDQTGLEWEEDLFGVEPKWTKEPSVDIIKKLAQKHLNLGKNAHCTISFFAEGAFNKLYAIDCVAGSYIMRVSLPVAPEIKTNSEIATLSLVHEKTDIPVPRVFAYDANLKNELGFEWMLMERIDAQPLHQVWHEMSWLKKGLLVQQVAGHMAQLFRIEFSGLRSLYFSSENNDCTSATADEYAVGELVQPSFFKGDNIRLNIPRGPFSTIQDYFSARIQLLAHFASKLDPDDEDDLEHHQDVQAVLSSLESIIPRLFPNAGTPERTIICNRDISTSNILVSPTGNLTSIVDWECVTILPPCFAVQLPAFLKGPTRNDSPPFPEDPSSEVYKEQVELYEVTQLRRFFLEEMARIEPRWIEVFEKERMKHDILVALDKCENDMTVKWARGWLEAVTQGRIPRVSLTDACRNPLQQA